MALTCGLLKARSTHLGALAYNSIRLMQDFSVIEFEAYLKNNQPLLLDVREQ
jgi:hypothetical protein